MPRAKKRQHAALSQEGTCVVAFTHFPESNSVLRGRIVLDTTSAPNCKRFTALRTALDSIGSSMLIDVNNLMVSYPIRLFLLQCDAEILGD